MIQPGLEKMSTLQRNKLGEDSDLRQGMLMQITRGSRHFSCVIRLGNPNIQRTNRVEKQRRLKRMAKMKLTLQLGQLVSIQRLPVESCLLAALEEITHMVRMLSQYQSFLKNDEVTQKTGRHSDVGKPDDMA